MNARFAFLRANGYYFVTTPQQALSRNQQREGRACVPPVAIYSTAARLVAPTYAEGFDRLYYVYIAEDSSNLAPQWRIEEVQRG